MPIRLTAWRAAPAALLLLPLLSGCGGPGPNEFPPACPTAGLAPPTDDITLYRPGGRRDLLDQVLHGRIAGINGTCSQGDDKSRLALDVTVDLQFTRGPAMQDKSVAVPIFIAVTEGDRILDKRIYDVPATFPQNEDRASRTSAPVHMVLPVSPTKSGAAYHVVAGFQLTPADLEAARARQ